MVVFQDGEFIYNLNFIKIKQGEGLFGRKLQERPIINVFLLLVLLQDYDIKIPTSAIVTVAPKN